MFIPVSIAEGTTSVNVTADLSGILVAACSVEYNSQVYAPNTAIPVAINTSFKLITNVVASNSILVTFSGKDYYWHTSLPTEMRYVDGFPRQEVQGSTYGNVLYLGSQTSVPFVEQGVVTKDSNLVVAIFSKAKEIWFLANTGAKKITVSETPIDVVYTPVWSETDGVETTAYVITKNSVIRLTDQLELELPAVQTYASSIFAACGYTNGLVLAFENSISTLDVVNATNNQLTNIGANAIQTLRTGAYVIGQSNGVISRLAANGSLLEPLFTVKMNSDGVPVDVNSRFQLNVDHPTNIYAIDMANRLLIRIGESDSTFIHLDKVPSALAVTSLFEPLVGFFDEPMLYKYTESLDNILETLDTPSLSLASTNSEAVSTNLYSDASTVTKLESVAPLVIEILDYPVGLLQETTFIIPWARPTFVRVADSATVTVNGEVFSEGYLWIEDEVHVTLPAEDNHYVGNQVTFTGERPITVYFRTAAKLDPDVVVVPEQSPAFMKTPYAYQFDVTGITEGFTVPVSTDSPIMTFSVNGGPAGKSGTVKTGDTVDVYFFMPNLLTVEATHTITTDKGHMLSEWFVSPLKLEGVTVRQEVTQEKNRYPVIEHSPIANFNGVLEGSVVARDTLILEGYSASILQATTSQMGIDALRDTGASLLYEWAAEAELQGRTIVSQEVTAHRTINHVEGQEVQAEWTHAHIEPQEVQPVWMHAHVHEQEVQPVWMHAHVHEQSVYPELLGVSVYKSDSAIPSLLPSHRVAPTLESAFTQFHHTETVGVNYTYLQASTLEIPAEFDFYVVKFIEQEMTWNLRPLAPIYAFDMMYPRRLQPSMSKQDMGYVKAGLLSFEMQYPEIERTEQALRWSTDLLHVMLGYPAEKQGVLDNSQAPSSRRVTCSLELKEKLSAHSVYSTEQVAVPLQRTVISGVGEFKLNSSTQRAFQETYADLQLRGLVHEVGAEVQLQRISSQLQVDQPTAIWSVQRADANLAEEDSGFRASVGDATLDAEAINIPAERTSIKQYEGLFYFLSSPTAEGIVCSFLPRPPGIQRRYGYVSGG